MSFIADPGDSGQRIDLAPEAPLHRRHARWLISLVLVNILVEGTAVLRGHLVALIYIVFITWTFSVFITRRLRLANRPEPYLELTADKMTVFHPTYTDPIDVPLESVHSMRIGSIKVVKALIPRPREQFKGSLPQGGWFVRELYTRGGSTDPNLLIVLVPAVSLPPTENMSPWVYSRLQASRGLLLRLKDLESARHALTAWAGYRVVAELPDDVWPYLLQDHSAVRARS